MLEVLAAAMIVSISGAVAPGPLTTYAVGSLTRRPLAGSALLTLGHAIPELGIVVAIACGIRSLPFTDWIALAGSVVLFIFGVVQVLRPAHPPASSRADAMPFAYGITVTVSNPYWWVWWLTFGAGFLAVHDSYAEFFAGHIGIDFLWLLCLATLAARGRTILGDHYRVIVQGCGLAMMIFAVYFAISVIGG
jgi:threonine/homoserine/homoserine lactone efflux protein